MLIAFPSLIFAIITLLVHFTYKSKTEAKLDDLKMELLGESENKTSFEAKYNQAVSELKRYEELKKGKDLDEIQLLFAKVNMLDDKITFLNSSSKNKFDTIISMIESLKSLNEDNTSLIKNIIIDSNENEKDVEDINNSFNHIQQQTAVKELAQAELKEHTENNETTNKTDNVAESHEVESKNIVNNDNHANQPKVAPIFTDSYSQSSKKTSEEEEALKNIFSSNTNSKEKDIFNNTDAYSNDFLEEDEGNTDERSYTFNDVFDQKATSKDTTNNDNKNDKEDNIFANNSNSVDNIFSENTSSQSNKEDNFLLDLSQNTNNMNNDNSTNNNQSNTEDNFLLDLSNDNSAPSESVENDILNEGTSDELEESRNDNSENSDDVLDLNEIEEISDNKENNNENVTDLNADTSEIQNELYDINEENKQEEKTDHEVQDKTVVFEEKQTDDLDASLSDNDVDADELTSNEQNKPFDNNESYDINLINLDTQENNNEETTEYEAETLNGIDNNSEYDKASTSNNELDDMNDNLNNTNTSDNNVQDISLSESQMTSDLDNNVNSMEYTQNMQEVKTEYDDSKELNKNISSTTSGYEDFPPMPTYIDKDGVLSSNSNEKSKSNNVANKSTSVKAAPRTSLSSASYSNNDDNVGFDIKESIEKLKAQLNENNE